MTIEYHSHGPIPFFQNIGTHPVVVHHSTCMYRRRIRNKLTHMAPSPSLGSLGCTHGYVSLLSHCTPWLHHGTAFQTISTPIWPEFCLHSMTLGTYRPFWPKWPSTWTSTWTREGLYNGPPSLWIAPGYRPSPCTAPGTSRIPSGQEKSTSLRITVGWIYCKSPGLSLGYLGRTHGYLSHFSRIVLHDLWEFNLWMYSIPISYCHVCDICGTELRYSMTY